MTNELYPNNGLYGHIDQIERYWKDFKPDENTIVSHQEKLRQLTGLFEQISYQNCVLVLIGNTIENRIVYAVDKRNVVGYDMSLYLAKDGIPFSLSNLHPDFAKAMFSIERAAFDYMTPYKGTELNKIVVNYDGFYKRSNGDYFHFLQQAVCIETDHTGFPILFLSYIHDITYLKKGRTANLIITAPNEIKLWSFNFDTQNLEPLQSLTVQEKKVLSYLIKGKESKDIAKELCLSSHTIDTHRRNLLKKTNCLDTSGMITYAKLVGLI